MEDSLKPRVALLDSVQGMIHGKWVFSGKAYGHPNIPNGSWCTTSGVLSASGFYVETENTVYVLARRETVIEVIETQNAPA